MLWATAPPSDHESNSYVAPHMLACGGATTEWADPSITGSVNGVIAVPWSIPISTPGGDESRVS